MKKSTLILLALASALAFTGCTNVRQVGHVNGLDVTRITTRGVFSPSQTITVFSNTNQPGTIDGMVSTAGKGVLEAVAQAAATPFEGYLRKPDQTVVNQAGGGAVAVADADAKSKSTANANANSTGSTGNTHNNNNGNQHNH